MIYSGTVGLNGLRRRHLYEPGITPQYIYDQIRDAEPERLIIVSAVGALNPSYEVGNIIVVKDVITLFCPSPLTGFNFQDMSNPINSTLYKRALDLGDKIGTHIFVRGPHFETFADKQALRILGADTVGMSIVPELISAVNLGIPAVALGLVTNLAFVKHAHTDVLQVVNQNADRINSICNELENIAV